MHRSNYLNLSLKQLQKLFELTSTDKESVFMECQVSVKHESLVDCAIFENEMRKVGATPSSTNLNERHEDIADRILIKVEDAIASVKQLTVAELDKIKGRRS